MSESNLRARFYLIPWSSLWGPLYSDLKELYFFSLVEDKDALRYTVEDETGARFQVVVEQTGPYRITDEQHLVHYWSNSPEGRGWTFSVENPAWVEDLTLREVFIPSAKLYAVATLDACLEVLAEREPRVLML